MVKSELSFGQGFKVATEPPSVSIHPVYSWRCGFKSLREVWVEQINLKVQLFEFL